MKNRSALGLLAATCPLAILAAGQLALADGGANHTVKQTTPVKMGTSGGSVNDRSKAFCCGGTLGSAVTRNGVLSILSNNHVVGRSGSATAGEDTIQPALIDTGCNGANSNIVGDYAGNIVPLGTANVDAAISTARANMVDSTGAIIDIGVPCVEVVAPAVGMSVRKSGRTTGFTTSSITAINTSVSIQYQKGCNSGGKFTITYTNQIVTGAMSAGGDSGSLTLTNNDTTPNPVGLLFAGSSSTTIHNRATDVVSAFQSGGNTFSFVGNSCGSIASGGEPLGFATPAQADIDRVRPIKERNEAALFQHPGVLGVGVGATENDPTQAAVVVFLESPSGRVPRSLPTDVEGTPVRVILTDTIVAQ